MNASFRSVLETTVLLFLFVGNALASYAVVRRDVARLDEDARARAWPESSIRAATFGFGPFAVVLHFVRTRRSMEGLVLGIVWMLALVGTSALLSAAFEAMGLLHAGFRASFPTVVA
ncbi:MAG: hypothetical protein U0169_20455 [Polyangiaceae bacterium]